MIDKHIILIAEICKDKTLKMDFEILLNRLKYSFGENKVSLAYLGDCKPNIQEIVTKHQKIKNGKCKVHLLPVAISTTAKFDNALSQAVEFVLLNNPSLRISILPPIGEYPEATKLIPDEELNTIVEIMINDDFEEYPLEFKEYIFLEARKRKKND